MKFISTLIAAGAVLAAGCTMEPRYHRPALPVDSGWPTGPAYQTAASGGDTDAALLGWREFFTDARLQQVIELALANNRDLRVAALNILAARAQYRIQRSALLPTIDGTGTEQTERTPAGVNGSPATGIFRNYSVGVGFTSYELDLFGRIRSLNHQALEQYFSYVETRRSTQISLIAEVAQDYLTYLADLALLKLTQDTLDSQQHSYDLTKQSFDHDVVTELALRQAETSVDTAKANLAQYVRQVAQDRNALRLVVGADLPESLLENVDLDDAHVLADLPAGIPSEVLTKRPDVQAAEHSLLAANANIGAARAAFFPMVSLTGSFGTASTKLDGLFKDGSSSWTFAPTISIPIFAGGSNLANLDLAKIEKRVEIANYEKAIQTAFSEVSNSLAARGTLNDQLAAQQQLQQAAQVSYNLSDLRFRNGIDTYLDVLDSQRTLYSAQQGVIAVKLNRLDNLVTLYKVLGGGWNEHTVATSTVSNR